MDVIVSQHRFKDLVARDKLTVHPDLNRLHQAYKHRAIVQVVQRFRTHQQYLQDFGQNFEVEDVVPEASLDLFHNLAVLFAVQKVFEHDDARAEFILLVFAQGNQPLFQASYNFLTRKHFHFFIEIFRQKRYFVYIEQTKQELLRDFIRLAALFFGSMSDIEGILIQRKVFAALQNGLIGNFLLSSTCHKMLRLFIIPHLFA